ncbi:MAG: purine-nucleoside phosphorylase [Acidobacteria bacterium]|nr:purine-nucleoside phosphorylase [Acidobacteriota bacterium]
MKPYDIAASYLIQRLPRIPSTAIVLGSGLGVFANSLEDTVTVPYAEIPNWPHSTAVGHAGTLLYGRFGSFDLILLSGRAHFYEGYNAQQVTFAVRVMGKLGIRSMVFTNAAGGINLAYEQGTLVLISDHINLQGTNPLIGLNDDAEGARFPDMSDAYCEQYRFAAKQVAAEQHITLAEGVYAALSGPSYETPAEIRYLRTIGADLVGMSTVPEVIVANHMGMKVLAISCVTNMAAGILPQKINHEEVLETGTRVRETLVRYLEALLPRLEA